MRSLEEIEALATQKKGGAEKLAALLGEHNLPKSEAELDKIGDDRWLAMFTKCVFQAGFSWKVIEQKWPGFEEAFQGFDVARLSFLPDEAFEALLKDTRIVRNGAKIKAVQDNAVFLKELAIEHGSAARFFSRYPVTDQIGLMELMKKRGSRLGGTTGQLALRFMGKESFILTGDVVNALIRENVIENDRMSKKNLKEIQVAFNDWKTTSGRSFNEISRILAFSVGTSH
ncbi:DNA-3-methyladenine glycosylase I [Roseibium album]|uniref:3-methyl-adenine DNA glycosylase I n=1 Tax=Roseibium album TaxID=311410 RepID=A0A0M6ZHR1_9HYPH|nr:DNA-3-methyladenine glycosylase I [Roseibium album]CTQ60963.1 3-methyl-adenine DNA glycosylase I [Roseibium album]CTQ64421.1 3-methyl-adenine DNA glycosylase I [Roseibium album]CTQ72751.1 3-methyl-adenine DNA glycosylase I [Roseibium album]